MRRWLVRIGLVLAAPVACLLLLEGVLALAGVRVPRYAGFQDGGAYWIPCELEGRPPGYTRCFPRNYKQAPEELPLFLRDKPGNGWRVFVLGESSVKGLPYEVGCFSDWLRLRARAMLPGRTVEVVNAGNVGWHASDIRTLAQECLEHEPDLLIWMVGHNEFVPHNVLTLRRELERPVLHALQGAVSGLRTARWLGRYLPALRPQRESVFDQLQSEERPCFGPELPLLRQRFREATAGVVADARAAGVPIILCTMARNLRQSPPSYSYYSEAMRADPALRAHWDEAYAAGLLALQQGDAPGALAALGQALALDSTPAKLHYALGQAHAQAGQAEEARAAYARALEQDASPMRAQAWAEQAIRDVAAESGAPLADLQTLFDGSSPLGVAGNELIFDNCHPNLRGHELIAQTLLELIERQLQLPFDRSRDVPPERGRALLGLDQYGAFLAQRGEALNLVKLALQSGAVDDLWTRASESCTAVLQADPADWEVQGGLGLLEALAGRAAEARGLIEAAMAKNPYVKTSYVYFWTTEPAYRRAFAAAGLDMAAVEASLSPSERSQVQNRLYQAQLR
ncbi:MAG TPA: tetratricopeptide repeat protein [Planctomycetota bacterium]|nr:tetratricopeptide repeat protein [Planctomycetota bacterium]